MRRWAIYAVTALGVLLAAVVGIGYMLPVAHVASADAMIAAPPDHVFALLTDVSAYPRWRPDVSRVEVLSRAPVRWRERGSTGDITFEIQENMAPARLVTRIADPTLPFGGTWTFQLTPTSGGTRVTITEHGEVYNPVFRFVSRFVFGHTATIEQFLTALKRAAGQVR